MNLLIPGIRTRCRRLVLAGVLAGSGAETLAQTSYLPSSTPLMNINLGAGNKSGPAAVAKTASDFWNFFATPSSTYGTLANLKWSDGTTTSASLVLENAPGVWGNATGDPMMDSYVYPWNGGNVVARVQNLPAGTYTVLVYGAWGGVGNVNGNYDVQVGSSNPLSGTTVLGSGWTALNWTANEHFAGFGNLPVSSGQEIRITAKPAGDVGLINGIQIYPGTSSPVTPPSSRPPCYTIAYPNGQKPVYTFSACPDPTDFDNDMRSVPANSRIVLRANTTYDTRGSYAADAGELDPGSRTLGFYLKNGWEIEGNNATLRLVDSQIVPASGIRSAYLYNSVLRATLSIPNGISVANLVLDCLPTPDATKLYYVHGVSARAIRDGTLSLYNVRVTNATGTMYTPSDGDSPGGPDENFIFYLLADQVSPQSAYMHFVVTFCSVDNFRGSYCSAFTAGGRNCNALFDGCTANLNGRDHYGFNMTGTQTKKDPDPVAEQGKTRLGVFRGNYVIGFAGRGFNADTTYNGELQLIGNNFANVRTGFFIANADSGIVSNNVIVLADRPNDGTDGAHRVGIHIVPKVTAYQLPGTSKELHYYNTIQGASHFAVRNNWIFEGVNTWQKPGYGVLESFAIMAGLKPGGHPSPYAFVWPYGCSITGNHLIPRVGNPSPSVNWCNMIEPLTVPTGAGNLNWPGGTPTPGNGWYRAGLAGFPSPQ